jgi:hypothetical protein
MLLVALRLYGSNEQGCRPDRSTPGALQHKRIRIGCHAGAPVEVPRCAARRPNSAMGPVILRSTITSRWWRVLSTLERFFFDGLPDGGLVEPEIHTHHW